MKLFLIAIFLLAHSSERSQACAIMSTAETKAVAMGAEKALIVWNSKTKREDFYRTVKFNTDSKDLGFLVPVPSMPEINTSRADLFEKIDRYVHRNDPVTLGTTFGSPMLKGAVPAVRVLDSYVVAGMQVSILEADTIDPLMAWLKENHFQMSNAAKAWLKPYITSKFKIAAFHFLSGPAVDLKKDRNGLQTKVIRISFKADVPFYPYSEPSDAAIADYRNLELLFLSDQKLRPFLGRKPELTYWVRGDSADKRPDSSKSDLGKAMEVQSVTLSTKELATSIFNGDSWIPVLPANGTMLRFSDPSGSRPPKDLYFE